MAKYSVKSLLAMEDSDLMDLMGLTAKLEEFKQTLQEASTLEGEKLKDFEKSLNTTLNPSVYTDSLRYDLDRAKSRRKDIEDTCGCVPHD